MHQQKKRKSWKFNSLIVRIFSKNKKAFRPEALPPAERFPQHVAIIMDGNGRWARSRGMPRSFGHSAGAERFRAIGEYCTSIGISELTIFAFSTENWKRSQDEVSGIIGLLRRYLEETLETLPSRRTRLRIVGLLDALPDDIRATIERIHAISACHSGIIINICINYGGRSDILCAARKLAELPAEEREAAGEAVFGSLLCVPDDVDLLIRTGAEKRVSNFLLWQSAYAELYFTDALWPDFSEEDLNEALRWYAARQRRFGDAK